MQGIRRQWVAEFNRRRKTGNRVDGVGGVQ